MSVARRSVGSGPATTSLLEERAQFGFAGDVEVGAAAQVADAPQSGSATRIEPLSLMQWLVVLLLNVLMLPVALVPLWGSFFVVNPQEAVLLLFLGRLFREERQAGVYWFPLVGRTAMRISLRTQSLDIKKTTVVDANGNPIVVAGVVTFRVVNPVRAAFDVVSVPAYLERQSLAVLKQVCSRWPYESRDGHSLQTESAAVSREMVSLLQAKADVAGALILSFELADLAYAPEIAAAMLVRQQAQALVSARRTVVEGACGIVLHALEKMREGGVALDARDQARLTSTLLAVICGDAHVQPVYSLESGKNDDEAAQQMQTEMLRTLRQIQVNTTRPGQVPSS